MLKHHMAPEHPEKETGKSMQEFCVRRAGEGPTRRALFPARVHSAYRGARGNVLTVLSLECL